jgi:hypothetical protein
MSPTFVQLLARATRPTSLALIAAAILAVAGCASVGSPPPPPAEATAVTVRPPKPHPHAMWVQGHYVYQHGRYHWVPGHWTRR